MSGALVLVNLIGYVALLLWGTHMVQTGILRAFGSDLRHLLAKGLRNRIAAFLAGLGITAAIQSSTATGLLTTSFAATGMVDLVPARSEERRVGKESRSRWSPCEWEER